MKKTYGGRKQQRALDTYVKLIRASETVHAEAIRTLAESELSASQFAVLEALHHVGPMILSQLARKLLKTGGNLTMVVDNLEKRDLARRVYGTEDRRYVQVEATTAGHKLIEKIFPAHAEKITEMLGRLTAAEQEELGRLCRKLGTGSAIPRR